MSFEEFFDITALTYIGICEVYAFFQIYRDVNLGLEPSYSIRLGYGRRASFRLDFLLVAIVL